MLKIAMLGTVTVIVELGVKMKKMKVINW